MYSLNALVKITNPLKSKKYGGIGEILGYAELIPWAPDKFSYAVEFENDNLTYIYEQNDFELTGAQGNRRTISEAYLHLDTKDGNTLIYRIRDSINTEKYKPTFFKSHNAFVFKLREEYVLEYIVSAFRGIIKDSSEFKDSEFLVVDYSDVKNISYFGMGDEILELCDSFRNKGGKEYFFVGVSAEIQDVLEMLIADKYPKSFKSLSEVFQFLNNA